MKKRGLLVLSICIGIALLLGACGPDRQLGYQAVLTGPGGIPVANGDYTVIVNFWNDPTAAAAGNLIYHDDQTVAVTNGILNIAIPDQVTEADSLDPADFARPLWVELTINGETLSPRQKLLGTPYAYTLVGGAVIMLEEPQVGPVAAAAPERGALTIGNGFASSAAGSPGATGLVVGILDNSDSEIIRACSGALGCTDTYRVFSVRGNGDVSQSATGNGLVKAAVYASCTSIGTTVWRYFNNVTGGAVTIAGGGTLGRCTLDFGFDISSHYWVANAVSTGSYSVTCVLNAGSNNKLDCYRFDEAGAGVSGNIMVTLY
jgi:hypothetical protein